MTDNASLPPPHVPTSPPLPTPPRGAPPLNLPRFVKPGLLMLAAGLALTLLASLAVGSRNPPITLIAIAAAVVSAGKALVGAGLVIWGLDRDRDEQSWRSPAALIAGALLLAGLSMS